MKTQDPNTPFKVLWSGKSPNWLGDMRHQVVLGVTPEMGISILGPEHRIDHHYGLPDQRQAGFNGGVAFILKGLRREDCQQCFKVAAIRFLKDGELPEVLPSRDGLRFQPVGYIGIDDSYERNWSGGEILTLVQSIQANGEAGIHPDAHLDESWRRSLRYARFIRTMSGVRILVDRTNPCHAKPSPITQPMEFAHSCLNGQLPPKGIMKGFYAWTIPSGAFGMIVIAEVDGKLVCALEETPGSGGSNYHENGIPLTKAFFAKYPKSLQKLCRLLKVGKPIEFKEVVGLDDKGVCAAPNLSR